MNALDAEQLVAGYGHVTVLRNVDLHVDEGEVVGVIGANGAGKTTLLRVLSGLLPTSEGRIRLSGEEVTGWPAERLAQHGVAHVPENRLVFPGLTVQDNLDLGAYTRRGADTSEDRDLVFDLFAKLSTRSSQRAGTLSGGEQQMLAIGRALMARPRVLLLDEPSLGLAPLLVREILAALARLRRGRDVSILLVEQNVRAALAISDRAYVFDRGEVVAEGPSHELAEDPQVQQTYLGGRARTETEPTSGTP